MRVHDTQVYVELGGTRFSRQPYPTLQYGGEHCQIFVTRVASWPPVAVNIPDASRAVQPSLLPWPW